MKFRSIILFFTILLGGTFWFLSDLFVDREITAKWYFALFGTTLLCWIYGTNGIRHTSFTPKACPTVLFHAITLCAITMAVHGLLQWSGILPSHATFPVCGCFDNPAGFASALAFSLPFSLQCAESPHKHLRLGSYAGTALIFSAIVASGSRAGFLSAGCVLLLYGLMKYPNIGKAPTLGFVILLVLCSALLYLYKKDSADGRILIWQCTWNMIKRRPLIGYGYGGFRANYMNEQAFYFRTHPDSRYALLADNVNTPFNEYLGFLTDFGLIGGIALLSGIILLFRTWRKHPYGSSCPAALCLIAIAVFALFSYPFRYPHTWLLCAISTLILLRNAHHIRWNPGILFFCTALLLTLISILAFRRMQAEIRWKETADRSLCGMTEQMLPVYKELYTELKDEPLFLYNYTAELNVAGRYEESLRIGKECETLMADYFVQILQADNCKQLKQYDKAERYLQHASYMCPNRFTPLHELYMIYDKKGDSTSMYRMANTILLKPIKIDSPEVRRIISRMRQFKSSYNK